MDNRIEFKYLSQTDFLEADCFDIKMAMEAAAKGLVAFDQGKVLFPEKIVQIFNEDTQERINCLPATFKERKICGAKWVSVFPPNPAKYGVQNLSATIILSEIEKGFPIAVMDGTLCSNMRVAAMGALAASHLARRDSEVIGFIGAGEQSKMHFIGMKTVFPDLKVCKVSAKTHDEELSFINEMKDIFPEMEYVSAETNGKNAIEGADIIVTGTSAQAPLLKADWIKKGVFYSHIGGWEDEYAVALGCDKIVCDDWETVKHRTQTLSRMYKDGELTDADVYGNLSDLITGRKPGRESAEERTYFNAVGLAYVDVAIAHAMFLRTERTGLGQDLKIQHEMIFEHANLKDWVRF